MIDIKHSLQKHITVVEQLSNLIPTIETVADKMLGALQAGGKIIWMGNGGSAADSQHLAAELVGRYSREREGLASIALTTDTSILTAVANDYGYEAIFARQIDALCVAQDVVVGISTSGTSPNVLAGFRAAKAKGAYCLGLTGRQGGEFPAITDECLIVPCDETARIQECHLLIGHILCDWIEAAIVNKTQVYA